MFSKSLIGRGRRYEYGARTHVGQQRGRNEDNLIAQVINSRFMGAVADGMGGHQAGEKASRLAIEVLKDAAAELGETHAVCEVLVQAAQSINLSILRAGTIDEQLAGMGTTLTAAVVEPGRVWLVHVGDSRAYLLREGQIAQLTADDSLVEELVRRGHLSEAQAQLHPQRNLLLQALGVAEKVEVETQEETLQAGDVLLLCSDGLTNMVPDRDIAAIVNTAETLEVAAEKLISAANTRGGYDNITVVLVRCPGGVEARAEAPSTSQASASLRPPDSDPRSGDSSSRRKLWFLLWKIGMGMVFGAGLLWGGGRLSETYLQRQFFLGVDSQGEVVLYQGLPRLLLGRSLYHLYQPMEVPAKQVKDLYRGRLQKGIMVSSPQEAKYRLQEILEPDAENGKASHPL